MLAEGSAIRRSLGAWWKDWRSRDTHIRLIHEGFSRLCRLPCSVTTVVVIMPQNSEKHLFEWNEFMFVDWKSLFLPFRWPEALGLLLGGSSRSPSRFHLFLQDWIANCWAERGFWDLPIYPIGIYPHTFFLSLWMKPIKSSTLMTWLLQAGPNDITHYAVGFWHPRCMVLSFSFAVRSENKICWKTRAACDTNMSCAMENAVSFPRPKEAHIMSDYKVRLEMVPVVPWVPSHQSDKCLL